MTAAAVAACAVVAALGQQQLHLLPDGLPSSQLLHPRHFSVVLQAVWGWRRQHCLGRLQQWLQDRQPGVHHQQSLS